MLSCLHPNQGDIIYGDQCGTISIWDLAMNVGKRETVAPKDGEDVAIRECASLCHFFSFVHPRAACC